MDETLAPSRTYPAAVEVYEAGLATMALWAVDGGGRRTRLPVADWSARTLAGDASLLARCSGPTLDVGCGPGRLVVALVASGADALGIDVSADAIAQARAAGGSALRSSVFGPLPGQGRWGSALLADGNIGIGGDPHALLRRIRDLLAPSGIVLVELAPPGAPTSATTIRLQDGSGRVSEWFAWAEVGVDGIGNLAEAAAFTVAERWQASGRWFARLSACRRSD